MKHGKYLIALVGLLILITGCAEKQLGPIKPTPQPTYNAQEARQRLASAEQAYSEKRYEDADRLFTDYLRRFPGQPGENLAWLRHGQIQLRYGFAEGAKTSFSKAIAAGAQGRVTVQAKIGLAGAYTALKRPRIAAQTLLEVNAKNLEPSDRVAYNLEVSRARYLLRQPKTALMYLVRAYREATHSEREDIEFQLDTFVKGWSGPTLEKLKKLYSTEFPTKKIIAGLAGRAAERNDWQASRKLATELETRFSPKKATPIEEKVEEKPVKEYTIGVLLPLSGPLEEYGNQLLNGIQLAVGSFKGASGFSLVIEDTANDPLITQDAVLQLSHNPEVMAIVGPLRGSLARAAGERADAVNIPLVTLTQSSRAAKSSNWVFRNFISPVHMNDRLVERAIGKLGLVNFAILHPSSRYGIQMAKKFSDAVLGLNGVITKTVTYQPNSVDLGEAIIKLGGREPQNQETESELGFEALFIPDDAKAVAQLAPQLAFYDLSGITLLGTNLWHEEELLELAGPYVKGAIFPTAFYPEDKSRSVEEFVRDYLETYGEQPKLFAALGYDAARLIVEMLRSHGPESRAELREILAGVRDYPGITGLLNMDPNGEAVKEPYILTVTEDGFGPAPTEPVAPPDTTQVLD